VNVTRSRRQILRWTWRGAAAAAVFIVLAYPAWQLLDMLRTDTDRRGSEFSESWQVPTLNRGTRRVLLLMIDGLSVPSFEKALADGLMPNLRQLMRDRPTSSVTAVSTFPSATSPSVQELLSGRYAELDNLASPGAVHAFDREARRIVRYVTEPESWQWPVPTIFDATRGLPVVTVFEGRWDGPTTILTQYNMASQAILAALGASALSSGDAGPVEVYLDIVRNEEPPVLSLVVLNEFDMAAHFYGPDSAEAHHALGDCDDLIGEILATMASTSLNNGSTLLDTTTILVFGDHGIAGSGQFVDLPAFFARDGLETVDVSTIPHVVFRERLGRLWTEWPDAILVAGGSNVTQVYLRRPSGGWSDNGSVTDGEARRVSRMPPLDSLIRRLAELDGVDQVLRAGPGGETEVYSDSSKATIIERKVDSKRQFAYVVDPAATTDPLGYLADDAARALVCRGDEAPEGACFHDTVTWTDRTYESPYPGAVPLIPKAFSPARFAGDLIVTARAGYSFLRDQNGDHGNLARDAVLTPLILNGPGIRPCRESHVPRLVDIYPTVSVLLGAATDDPALSDLDGRILDCVREPVGNLPVE
jgi:hypothetical protein